jgi:putative transposase
LSCESSNFRGGRDAEEEPLTEEQIIWALKEVDAGAKVDEVCRRLGVTQTTFYRWESKFGGMEVSDAKRLKQLADDNRRLKQVVADLSLDLQAAKMVIRKNGETHGLPRGRVRRDEGVRSEPASRLPRARVRSLELAFSEPADNTARQPRIVSPDFRHWTPR